MTLRGVRMRKMILAMAVAGASSPGLMSMPALADARVDVVSGLTRCANITDDRQWLECYYGAAQPMRAWLGLPPAPQSQLKLLQTQPQPSALPATVSGTAVRGGRPPCPRNREFWICLEATMSSTTCPSSRMKSRATALLSHCLTARSERKPTTMPPRTRCAGVNPPQACG